MTKSIFQYILLIFLLLSATLIQSQNSHLYHFTVSDGLPQSHIIDVTQDNFGYLWIKTKSNEITRYNGEEFELQTKNNIENIFFNDNLIIGYNDLPDIIKQSVKKSSINKIIKDRQSVIWIATTNGLFKIIENNFKQFLKGHKITSLNNFNNKLLIGSPNNLTQLDSLGLSPLLNNKYINSVKSNSNQIFIGNDTSIFVLDSLKVIDTIDVKGKISKILIKDETIWTATTTNGIFNFSYDIETGSKYNSMHFNISEGIYDLNITDIQVDRIGRLWYASKNGFIGTIDKNIVKHLGKVLNTDVSITTLLFHDAKLFLGTNGRGVWWSEVNKELKFEKLKGVENLYSENINQLLFDSRDNLWIGTHKGLDKVTLNEETQISAIKHFGKNDGFLGIETTKNTILEDENGNLWFGTVNGLMKYEPIENKKNYERPTIFFEQIEVAYNNLDTIKLADWTDSGKRLYLKPTDNHISFSFRTVDLTFADDIQYRWRLNSTDWSPWTKETKVNYSSLNAGDYAFEAQSRIFSRNLSESIRFQFNVDLPLIKKPWFRQLLLIIGLLLVFWIVRNYFKKLKLKNEREQEVLKAQNHLLSLEQKALQLQMNPHFIFNVLNGIKAMGAKNTVKMNDTVNKFAVLLRQTLSNSRKEHISLSEEISTLKNYIEIEKSMSNNSFEYEMNFTTDIDTEEILIPPMLIQPFVENAIRHGISSIENGMLLIQFSVKEDELLCVVQDNGIGIEVSKRNKTKTNHQSMALEVTKERIESMSGKNSFLIEEMKDENKEVLGTKVSFKIPLLTDY